jgi:hypothetical protein
MKYRRHPYGKITSSCEKFKTRAQVYSTSAFFTNCQIRGIRESSTDHCPNICGHV